MPPGIRHLELKGAVLFVLQALLLAKITLFRFDWSSRIVLFVKADEYILGLISSPTPDAHEFSLQFNTAVVFYYNFQFHIASSLR